MQLGQGASDLINKDEIDTKVNKNNLNLPKKDSDERFYEWLAGYIDGDGCFLFSKKGYTSL